MLNTNSFIRSLKGKLILYICGLLLITFGLSVYFITGKVKEEIETKSNDQMFAMAESYGNRLAIDMNANMLFVKNLAAQMPKLRNLGRKQVNGLLKQMLTENTGYNGLYAMFEANAFDNKDKEYIGDHENATNIKGLYEPYWQRINGAVVSKILDNDESGQDYYAIPKRTMKGAIIEPYFDQGLLMTSYVYPIIEDGKFLGIVGLDIAIADIDKIVQQASLLKTGYFGVISKTGILIADKFKEKLGEKNIKQMAQDLQQPQLAGIIENIQSGKPGSIDYFDKRLNQDMRVYYNKFGTADWGILAFVPQEEIYEAVASTTRQILWIGLLAIGIATLIAIYLALKISNPVHELAVAAGKIEKNDFNVAVEIHTGDELEHLGTTFNHMAANLKASFEEIQEKRRAAQRSADEAESLKMSAQEQSKYLSASVLEILGEMDQFAKGDLTVKLPVSGTDDISKLFEGFNSAVTNIRNLMNNVLSASEATSSAGAEISSSTEEMAAGAQEQSSQMNEVASAVQEMSRTIFEMTKHATVAAETARDSGQKAKDGGDVVGETISGMNKIADVVAQSAATVFALGQNSEKIGEIVQVIDEIADQTNLLALNAAIEAARAGEQGRGFAVVADEVRKLAERTTRATKEIAAMIKAIQKDTANAVDSMKQGTREVENGKLLAEKAGGVLSEIVDSSAHLTDVVNQVAASSEELSSAAEEIGNNVQAMNAVTHESSSGIQQIAKAAEDLNRLTDNLQQLISAFKLLEGQSLRKQNSLRQLS